MHQRNVLTRETPRLYHPTACAFYVATNERQLTFSRRRAPGAGNLLRLRARCSSAHASAFAESAAGGKSNPNRKDSTNG